MPRGDAWCPGGAMPTAVMVLHGSQVAHWEEGQLTGGFAKNGDEASPASPVLAAFPSMARPCQVKPGRRQAAAQAVQAGAQQGQWE